MTTTPEAYVHLSTDETFLTFYYDTLRDERDGTTWGIDDTKIEDEVELCAWTGTIECPNTSVLSAIFDASFCDFRPTTTANWFFLLQSLKSIEGLEHLNTSQVKNINNMFAGCSSLVAINLENFDTSNAKDLSYMFMDCKSLTSLDVSGFDTSKVWNINFMFFGCESLTSLDLSSFDTSKVIDMRAMFMGCSDLAALDLSSFNTSEVTNASCMFFGCESLTTIYCNSTWSCEMSHSMFTGCTSLKGAVPYDESKTDASMANPEMGYFTSRR